MFPLGISQNFVDASRVGTMLYSHCTDQNTHQGHPGAKQLSVPRACPPRARTLPGTAASILRTFVHLSSHNARGVIISLFYKGGHGLADK